MVNPQLLQYVQYYKSQGYDKEAMRTYLKGYGQYSPEDIESALNESYGGAKKHTNPLLMIFGALLLLTGLVYILILILSPGGGQSLSLTLGLDQAVSSQGASLNFQLDFSVEGITSDVILEYKLLGGTVAVARGQDSYVPGSGNKRGSLLVPITVSPGQYILEVNARAGGELASVSREVTIEEQQQGNLEFSVIEQTPIISKEKEQFVYNLDKLVDQVMVDPTSVVGLCEKNFQILTEVDACYSRLGIVTSNEVLCRKIQNVDLKDTCFMNLMIDTRDYVHCGELGDGALKNQCLQWAAL